MKTLYLTQSPGNIIMDDETKSVDRLESIDRYNIREIFPIKEPTKVVYGFKGNTEEVYAEEGDILIEFYDRPGYTKHVVVVNSKDWLENITANIEYEQKQKEEWAAKIEDGLVPNCSDCENKSKL